MPEEAPRRFLIAAGVTAGLPKTGDRIAESVDVMSALFQEKFGYERVTSLGLNPSAKEMLHELRDFAKKCNSGDIVALYYTGHGDVVNTRHRLWMGDNTGDRLTGTLLSSDLTEQMLTDTSVTNLLIILDVCFAGQGGAEALLAGMQLEGGLSGRTLVMVTAAHPREQIMAGDFARLFGRAVDDLATAGHEPRYLALDAILRHIENDPDRKEWQTITPSTLLNTGDPGFFPNPRYDPAFHGYDLATQLQMEQDEERRQDLEKFFNPRARGVDVPQEAGWNFVGRHVALRDLTAWLDDQGDQRTIVVTGDPGSGKSAVIGRLYVLSLPDWGKAVPRQGLPADTIPPTGSIKVAIRASNRTSQEILAGLCSAARVTAATPGEFLRAVAGTPMVAAIDAIDEAIDPYELVSGILNPLVDAGPKAGLRLLLGTRSRSYSLELLSPKADRVDLDDARYADPESLRIYAERRLLAVSGSPYATAEPATVQAVAEAIAEAAGRSFLVALIASRTQAARTAVADPEDLAWRDDLPGTAAEAMQRDLETRLGADAIRARDLLRPLAYARGDGLPWEDLWAPLASLLAGRDYRDDDLIWLRRQAGSYVVEALESGRSAYRLYHAALAEYLRHGQDERHLNSEFTRFLLSHVPRAASGERNWPAAHPYILSHLATHAAAAGELQQIILDPTYLACAAPPGLLAAFASARDPDTRLVATAYERAMHRLRASDLADRLSYLELAARRARATVLAGRIEAHPLPRRWSVRWTQWPPDHPHRVLAGHSGPVNEVVGIPGPDRAQAASVGDDGTLRLWDLATAEPHGVHRVGHGSLTAVDLAELPGPRRVIVVLSAAGWLTVYELPAMSVVLDTRVLAGRGRVLQRLQVTKPEMRCVRLPGGRPAAVIGGRGIRTTIWDVETGKRIVRLQGVLRPAMLEFSRLASGDPIVASIAPPGQEQIFDLATGRRVPGTRTFIPSPSYTYYYRYDDKTPVIALRADLPAVRDILFRRDQPRIFDLTGSPNAGPVVIPRPYKDGRVLLSDGSLVRLFFDEARLTWLPDLDASELDGFTRLSDTAHDPGSPNPADASGVSHAKPSASFPFVVTLNGRAISLSPVRASAGGRDPVVLMGHTAQVTDVAVVTGEAAALVSSGVDGTVRDWDISSGLRAAHLSSQPDDLVASVLATLPYQGRTVGVATMTARDENVAVLDLETGGTVARLDCTSESAWAVTCGPVPRLGQAAITFGSDGYARIWRLPNGDHVTGFLAYPGRVPIQAAYVPVPTRPLAVTCGYGEKAIVWDLVGRRIHDVLGKHTGWISTVSCGAMGDGTLVVATGGCDNRVNIWDVMRGRRVARLKLAKRTAYLRDPESGHAAAVCLAMIRHDEAIVLVLCENGQLKLFRKSKWRSGYTGTLLGGNGASRLAVLRLSDGRLLAMTGGMDGCLCAWDVEAALGGGERGTPPLVTIETEVAITGLSIAGDDTIVTSTVNGLAAFRLHADFLPGQG